LQLHSAAGFLQPEQTPFSMDFPHFLQGVHPHFWHIFFSSVSMSFLSPRKIITGFHHIFNGYWPNIINKSHREKLTIRKFLNFDLEISFNQGTLVYLFFRPLQWLFHREIPSKYHSTP